VADSTCIRRGASWCGAALAIAILLCSAAAALAAEKPVTIYYQGVETLALSRLELDPSTHITTDLNRADVAVYQGVLPAAGLELDALKARVRAGMGLLVITGHGIGSSALADLTGGAIRQTGEVNVAPGPKRGREIQRIAAVLVYTGPKNNPLATNISWRSAVRVHERSLLELAAPARAIVSTGAKDPVTAHTPVLVEMKYGKGTVFVLNVWLRQGDQRERIASYLKMLKGISGSQNYDFQRWPYFNWLLYDLTRTAAGVPVIAYGYWIAAPVPDFRQIVWLGVLFGAMFVAFGLTYLGVRRYSLRHPEEIDHFYQVDLPAAQSAGEADAPPAAPLPVQTGRGDPRWELVGFHRPLSGFFYNYLLALLVMIPFNFAVTFYIERNFVNPFLEARGAWAAIVQFMTFFFTLLDLGTGQAMVKYFAEYRVREPQRAITYAQFFIWFHAIAGMFQIMVLGLVAAIWMPQTSIAFLTWFVILHTLVLFPGFIGIFFNLFRALQRFDYAQLLIVLTYVLNPLLQMVCGIYMRHWGLMHPVFGEGMGVVFGFAIGGMLANLLMGAFCAIFYKQVGLRLRTIFLAHFDRNTIRESFVYGAKLTGGNLLGATSWALIPVIMGALLPNFLELNEIWILTFSLTFAYLETGAYIFSTLMPSISESYSQRMLRLTRRYLDQGIRWGLIVTMMLGAAFIAFSDVFVEGLLPPQFMRAVEVMALMHVWRAADFTTRLPDQVFQGVGRTGIYTFTAFIEHGSRIVLAWFLIKWFGFPGVFYAFIAASLLKSAFAWPLMGYLVAWPSLSLYQTIINPVLSALATYETLHLFAHAIWAGPGHAGSAWLVVLACLFGSLPVYMFFSGLFGWDEFAMAEFRDAAELVPAPFGAIARMAHWVTGLGCALSPLHGRFPGRMTGEAGAEAAELTSFKAELQ
jgi:O-antigen/teichoic acid export membrane protein